MVGVPEPLPKRCCGRCLNWTRLAPDDPTAPEGKCGLSKLPSGNQFWAYWPNTLQRDWCQKFKDPFPTTQGKNRRKK